ncbi:hypothetical protein WR25_13075 [Diploscapter pachys]|uniref:Uncharacterized protein n=1 Tax=Diploscapter pachys TaxID=2018661 RepID=A0A2A2M3U1_9BILA|nr:hypothetical protein WR25_13075 [Diploscapter pachys]
MDRPGWADHRFLVLHHDVTRRLALAHEVHDAVGIEIVELEVEIDFAAALVNVRRHRVPHAAGLQHGEAHHQLRAVADAGDDELEDRALVRFGEAAALERIGVGDAEQSLLPSVKLSPSTVTMPSTLPTLTTAISRRSRNGCPAADAGSVWSGSFTLPLATATPPITKRSACV